MGVETQIPPGFGLRAQERRSGLRLGKKGGARRAANPVQGRGRTAGGAAGPALRGPLPPENAPPGLASRPRGGVVFGFPAEGTCASQRLGEHRLLARVFADPPSPPREDDAGTNLGLVPLGAEHLSTRKSNPPGNVLG